MKPILQTVITFAILLIPTMSFAGELESRLLAQIAVEKLTGREGDNEFSGWVGSLRFDADLRIIYIAEFSKILNEIAVLNGVYQITRIEKTEKNINFECVDRNAGTVGIEWAGKIWLSDEDKVRIELVQKQSPRKWVNIGEIGKTFLKKNGLNLNLGQ